VAGDVQCVKKRSVEGNRMAIKSKNTTLSASKEQNGAEKGRQKNRRRTRIVQWL